MKEHLKTYDGGIYTLQQMEDFIHDWDMFECEDDDGNIMVALTNPYDGSSLPDCGVFVFDDKNNFYTFKYY